MGLLKNLKSLKAAVASGLTGGLPSDEVLASLPPEQRAAYDEQIAAAAERQHQVAVEQAARDERRPLAGPAGAWRYGAGLSGQLTAEQLASMSAAEQIEYSKAMSKAQFRDLLRNPFGGSEPPAPPPVPGASHDRGEQAAAERAERDRLRAPFHAPNRGPITFTRLTTRGGTQVEEVAAYLGSSGLGARPDLVFGAYRVPDAIGLGGLGGERSKVVEWDIVHGATEALAPGPAASTVFFDGEEQWVGRSIGQPSVLDEDLAITYLSAAGVGPDRSLGIARILEIRTEGGDESSSSTTLTRVTGVQVFHPSTADGSAAFEQMVAARPLALAETGLPGVRIEVLNWGAIAGVVHPANHKAVPIPSPFPYLPSTPQELIRAYLEVVGIHPVHCYSVQVTEDEARGIEGTGTKAGFTFSTNVGEEQPCADGTMRRRLTGGSVVVVAYLDTAAYVDGRERWAAYERDVLQARLHQGSGARRPVDEPRFDGLPGGIRGLVRVVDKVDSLVDGASDPYRDIPPHRYCWPPLDAG